MALQETEMASKVKSALEGTPFESSSFQVLSGGTANFVYRARLDKPLENGTDEILVKHGEAFIASMPEFKLAVSRCRLEEACLRHIPKFPTELAVGKGQYCFAVKTPVLHLFDEETNTQVQELLPNSIDLKKYALEILASATVSPEVLRAQCTELGVALGTWLRRLHEWAGSNDAAAVSLRQATAGVDAEMKSLKHMINFQWLLDRAAQYPEILGSSKEVFEGVVEMAKREMESKDVVMLHGDFWTGNILLPNSQIKDDTAIPVFVVDWELAHLGVPAMDIGQMMAELYLLYFIRDVPAGLWIIEGLARAYGLDKNPDLAFRAVLQTGVHLISFGTNVAATGRWGEKAKGQSVVESVAARGRDLLLMGWNKDEKTLETDELGSIVLKLEA